MDDLCPETDPACRDLSIGSLKVRFLQRKFTQRENVVFFCRGLAFSCSLEAYVFELRGKHKSWYW